MKRRGFLKVLVGGAVGAALPKAKTVVAKEVKRAKRKPQKGLRPLEGRGVSGDSVMTGNEEMLMFYDDE